MSKVYPLYPRSSLFTEGIWKCTASLSWILYFLNLFDKLVLLNVTWSIFGPVAENFECNLHSSDLICFLSSFQLLASSLQLTLHVMGDEK